VFEQAFKNIDDVLWKEAGCTTELDYTEQTSWLLFLKYLDGLEQDLADIQEKDRVDVVLANPPFGGKERKEVQQNFPIRTGEPAFLFLQHFVKMLRAGGRGGVVITNNFLSNTDNAQRRIVDVLDQAFEGIARARANAERELAALVHLEESLLHQALGGQF
jgi:type I restriction-modification system DNA methylase subunit